MFTRLRVAPSLHADDADGFDAVDCPALGALQGLPAARAVLPIDIVPDVFPADRVRRALESWLDLVAQEGDGLDPKTAGAARSEAAGLLASLQRSQAPWVAIRGVEPLLELSTPLDDLWLLHAARAGRLVLSGNPPRPTRPPGGAARPGAQRLALELPAPGLWVVLVSVDGCDFRVDPVACTAPALLSLPDGHLRVDDGTPEPGDDSFDLPSGDWLVEAWLLCPYPRGDTLSPREEGADHDTPAVPDVHLRFRRLEAGAAAPLSLGPPRFRPCA